MAPDRQVEKLVDEALKHKNFQPLESFLQNDIKEGSSFQCSRQFVTKLDKLFLRELDIGNVNNACLVLTILHKCNEMLVFPGGGGISVMITQGLVKKMVQWFERARRLWVEAGSSRNETLIKLAEDFFDALMAVHESCKEGKFEVTESLPNHICKLASDAKINVMIQKEAARKLNLILAKIPTELKKKKILSSQEATTVMSDVASRILKGGDFDLQVSLMEVLCRMTSPAQRNELAERWFTMTFVSSAFKKIKESEFETDCRRFLNMVNGMQGDGKSVYSYPCLEAFLDKHELLMPVDENLEAFWIDFNLGSQSISFYFSMSDMDAQDGQWDTLCIAENEVRCYTVEEKNGRKVLDLVLTDPVSTGSLEGSRVTIKFSSSLDILQATEKVYGQAKNKRPYRKTPSIVEMPIQVNVSSLECSQVLVLESQVSPSQRKDERESTSVRHGCPVQSLTHQTPDTNKMVTPVKMKVSESCTYVSGSVGRKQGSCSSSCVLPAVSLAKVKPALQMMSSSERKREFQLRDLMMSKTSSSASSFSVHCETNQKKGRAIQAQSTPAVQNVDKQQTNVGKTKLEKYGKQKITLDKVIEIIQADHEEENTDNNLVPDTQPAVRKGNYFSPSLWSLNSNKGKTSACGSLLALQKDTNKSQSVSDGASRLLPQRLSPPQRVFRTLTQKQLHTQLTQRLEEVLREQQVPDGHAAQQAKERRGSSLYHIALDQGKEKIKMSIRSSPARHAQQSIIDPGNASDTNIQKMAHTTDSMVKMISSHYRRSAKATSPVPGAQFNIAPTNRYSFNRSWCPSSTEKTTARGSDLVKTLEKSKRPVQNLDDVYAFKDDTPKMNVKKRVKSSETSRVDSSVLSNSSTCPKSVLKPQPSKAATKNVKKNLFSDTDTDNMTEISWLKSANRKPKPKVADYSRQPVKPTLPSANSAFKSPYTPLSSPKPAKEQINPKLKRQKKVAERKENKLQAKITNSKPKGRPQRAAVSTKTYKEPSHSDSQSSQSESEKPPPRTQRAAASTKIYKKPSYSDSQSSQSESEKPPPPKKKAVGRPRKHPVPVETNGQGQKKKTSSVDKAQREISQNKKSDKTPAQIQPYQTNETSKKDCSPEDLTVKKTPSAQGSARGHKESWTAQLSSTIASPPSIERMRSNEKLSTKIRSHTTPLRSLSISPIEPEPPKLEPLSSVREIKSSLCKTPGIKPAVKPPFLSTTTTKYSKQKSPAAQQDVLSPVQSIFSPTQPLITPTLMKKITLSSPLISANLQEEQRGVMNKTSPASYDRRSIISVTMSQSSHVSVSNMALICTDLEKTPASRRGSTKDEKPEFKSGPTVIYKPPSSCHSVNLSEREEDSEEDKENKPPSPTQLAKKMKPRKLFKTNDKHGHQNKSPIVKQPVKNQSSSEEEDEEITEEADNSRKKSYQNKRARETTKFTEDMETVPSRIKSKCRQTFVEEDAHHNQPAQEVGYICHQFTSELKRKIKIRSRKMDRYTRQSIKTFQQHMFSVRVKVQQYSAQKLEKVKQVLLGEIKSLEQDDIALRNMEEELMTHWKKQALAFHTYQEKGANRLEHLKSTFETDVCDSQQNEEQIFISEMSLMKNNLKSVQERFFKEMQEEELLSVRRGLQTLFLPDASRF
ncbi:synaptonemal complex protein 2 [Paramisgurnus dabryanus]|uniref:synaptonemal complex protein 2 n=1 Tax=Paramisgurnus dabryanus TaxID=90735 RepID=UPI003CCFDF81